jgi:hypothetical protein
MPHVVKRQDVEYDVFRLGVTEMGFAKSESEIAERVSRFVKARAKAR